MRNGALAGLAQVSLHFADGQLDRIEVGRVRRKIEQPCVYRFDRFLDTGDPVDWNIVHDHDIAAPERGSETLLHVSEEHRPVHRALDNERRDHCTNPQASHEGDRFPMSERGVTDQPLAARTAAAQPHNAGTRPAFVDEHQLCVSCGFWNTSIVSQVIVPRSTSEPYADGKPSGPISSTNAPR